MGCDPKKQKWENKAGKDENSLKDTFSTSLLGYGASLKLEVAQGDVTSVLKASAIFPYLALHLRLSVKAFWVI